MGKNFLFIWLILPKKEAAAPFLAEENAAPGDRCQVR